MVQIVCTKAVCGKFAVDCACVLFGKTFAVAAALNHEAGNHAVKNCSAVKAAVNKRQEIRHRLGRFVGVQFGSDLAEVLYSNLDFRVVHGNYLSE